MISLTSIPFQKYSVEKVNNDSDAWLSSLIINKHFSLKLIEKQLDFKFYSMIMDLICHPNVIQTLKYWKQKLEHFKIHNQVINDFLITKLLEICAFKAGIASSMEQGKINQKTSLNEYFTQLAFNRSKIANVPFCFVVPVFICNKRMLEMLQRMLISLYDQINSVFEIFLIDDGSPFPIHIPEHVKAEITMIRMESRSGPARARNIGTQQALENGYDVIIFADYDLIFPANWTKNLTQFIAKNEGDIFSCILRSYGNTWWDFYHDINGTLNGRLFNRFNEMMFATTAALAVKSGVLQQTHFNTNFINAAGEDIDFCLQARASGHSIVLLEDLYAYHDYGYINIPSIDVKTFFDRSCRYGSAESKLSVLHKNYYADLSETIEIPSMNFNVKNRIPNFPV